MSRPRRRRVAFALCLALAAPPAAIGCAGLRSARLYDSGTEALERGDPEQAVADLERAAALTPEVSEIHNHLGLAYAAQGRREDMLRAFRRAVALDCTNRSARHNLEVAEAGGATTPQSAVRHEGSEPFSASP